MGFWSKLFGSERAEEVREATGSIDGNADVLQALVSETKVTKNEASNIATLASNVDLISDAVAGLTIKLYRENGTSVEEITDDVRLKLLNDDTKDTLDAFQFKKAMVMDFLLEGAGYAYIKRNRNAVESLHYVEANQVSVMKGVDPIFKTYDIMIMGKKYRDFDFIKLARKSVDGVTGKGIVEEQNKILSVIYNTLVFEDMIVSTGGNKKGFLQATKKLSQEAIDALKAAWKNLYGNNKNTEKIVVLNDGVTFQEASATSVEMQMNENKQTNSKEIDRIFKVNGPVLDDNAIKSAVLPLLKAFETALNKDLLLPSEKEQSFYFSFDTKDLLKGDIEKRFKAYEIGVKNGFLQLDEVRYLEDYAPFGLDFIKLGLQDVLYNPKTGAIYTPNTDKTGSINNPSEKPPPEGGETNEN